MIYHNSQGKVIAESQNGRLYKRVDSRKHFMKIIGGYGIDAHILQNPDFEEVWLIETDKPDKDKIVYKSTLKDWAEHGIKKDFGHGEQVFLPLSKWSLTKVNENQLKLI